MNNTLISCFDCEICKNKKKCSNIMKDIFSIQQYIANNFSIPENITITAECNNFKDIFIPLDFDK
jgi:hypothetical protein